MTVYVKKDICTSAHLWTVTQNQVAMASLERNSRGKVGNGGDTIYLTSFFSYHVIVGCSIMIQMQRKFMHSSLTTDSSAKTNRPAFHLLLTMIPKKLIKHHQSQLHILLLNPFQNPHQQGFFTSKTISSSKHMTRCPRPLTMREMRMETTMSYHLIPIRMATIN